MNIRERIHIAFPQVVGVGRIVDVAIENLIGDAVSHDEDNGSGWGMLKDLVDGVIPSDEIRDAVEGAMIAEAEIMVDQMRDVVNCSGLSAGQVVDYFRIRTVYDAVSEAGLI